MMPQHGADSDTYNRVPWYVNAWHGLLCALGLHYKEAMWDGHDKERQVVDGRLQKTRGVE